MTHSYPNVECTKKIFLVKLSQYFRLFMRDVFRMSFLYFVLVTILFDKVVYGNQSNKLFLLNSSGINMPRITIGIDGGLCEG